MNELIRRLKEQPDDDSILNLVVAAESTSNVDLSMDLALLKGVWELRWSSATQPWLKQSNWLENLQVLDPANSRGMNLLRLAGPLGRAAAVTVEAELSTDGAIVWESDFAEADGEAPPCRVDDGSNCSRP